MQLLSERQIREYVIKLVRDAVSKYASDAIPTVDEILLGQGLDMKEGELPPYEDGALVGNLIIINSEIQSEERKQFTRFHEITHHLINQDGEIISILHDATWHQNDGYKTVIERLCNVGAAEFLMPCEEFRRFYKEKGFQAGLITEASHHFGSSTIATTIQLAQVAPYSCITAVCEYGLMPNQIKCQPNLFVDDSALPASQLHVVYSASSPTTKYKLAKYTVIPEGHPIYDAFFQSVTVEKESYIPFRSGKEMPCYCEALVYRDRIHVVFHIDPAPCVGQLELF